MYGLEDIPLDDVEAGDGFYLTLIGSLIVEVTVSMSCLLNSVLEAVFFLVERSIAGLGVAEGLLPICPGTVTFCL